MTEVELKDLLLSVSVNPRHSGRAWQDIQAEAFRNADSLTLPDSVKLDGVLELLEHVFRLTSERAPERLIDLLPVLLPVCSSHRDAMLLDTDIMPVDWKARSASTSNTERSVKIRS